MYFYSAQVMHFWSGVDTAIGTLVAAITAEDARNLFKNSGYVRSA